MMIVVFLTCERQARIAVVVRWRVAGSKADVDSSIRVYIVSKPLLNAKWKELAQNQDVRVSYPRSREC